MILVSVGTTRYVTVHYVETGRWWNSRNFQEDGGFESVQERERFTDFVPIQISPSTPVDRLNKGSSGRRRGLRL